MTMGLLLALVGLLVALRPVGFAAAPAAAAAGTAGGDTGGGAGGMAGSGGGGADPGTGGDGAGAGAAGAGTATAASPEQFVRDLVARELGDGSETPPATGAAAAQGEEGQSAPEEQGPEGQTEKGAAPAAFDAQQIFDALQLPVDEQTLATALAPLKLPPELQGPAAQVLKNFAAQAIHEFWQGRYLPAAQQTAAEYQRLTQIEKEQHAYDAGLRQFLASPAYQVAAKLSEKPGLLEKVAGQLGVRIDGSATSGPGAGVDLESLDPDTRRVYETMQQGNAALREQLGELTQRLEQMSAAQRAATESQWQATGGNLYDQAMASADQQFGVAVKQYPQHLSDAWEAVRAAITPTATHPGALAGVPADKIPAKLGELLCKGLRWAGLGEVVQRRKAQNGSAMRPPGQRTANPTQAPKDPAEFTRWLVQGAVDRGELRAE